MSIPGFRTTRHVRVFAESLVETRSQLAQAVSNWHVDLLRCVVSSWRRAVWEVVARRCIKSIVLQGSTVGGASATALALLSGHEGLMLLRTALSAWRTAMQHTSASSFHEPQDPLEQYIRDTSAWGSTLAVRSASSSSAGSPERERQIRDRSVSERGRSAAMQKAKGYVQELLHESLQTWWMQAQVLRACARAQQQVLGAASDLVSKHVSTFTQSFSLAWRETIDNNEVSVQASLAFLRWRHQTQIASSGRSVRLMPLARGGGSQSTSISNLLMCWKCHVRSKAMAHKTASMKESMQRSLLLQAAFHAWREAVLCDDNLCKVSAQLLASMLDKLQLDGIRSILAAWRHLMQAEKNKHLADLLQRHTESSNAELEQLRQVHTRSLLQRELDAVEAGGTSEADMQRMQAAVAQSEARAESERQHALMLHARVESLLADGELHAVLFDEHSSVIGHLEHEAAVQVHYLEMQLEGSSTKLTATEEGIASLKVELIEEHDRKQAVAQGEFSRLQVQLESYRREICELRAFAEERNAAADAADAAAAAASRELSGARVELGECSREIELLQDKVEAMRSGMEISQIALSTQQDEMLHSYAQARHRGDRWQDQFEAFEAEAKAETQAASNLRSQVESLLADKTADRAEQLQLSRAHEKMESETTELQAALELAESRYSVEQEHVANLRAEIDRMLPLGDRILADSKRGEAWLSTAENEMTNLRGELEQWRVIAAEEAHSSRYVANTAREELVVLHAEVEQQQSAFAEAQALLDSSVSHELWQSLPIAKAAALGDPVTVQREVEPLNSEPVAPIAAAQPLSATEVEEFAAAVVAATECRAEATEYRAEAAEAAHKTDHTIGQIRHLQTEVQHMEATATEVRCQHLEMLRAQEEEVTRIRAELAQEMEVQAAHEQEEIAHVHADLAAIELSHAELTNQAQAEIREQEEMMASSRLMQEALKDHQEEVAHLHVELKEQELSHLELNQLTKSQMEEKVAHLHVELREQELSHSEFAQLTKSQKDEEVARLYTEFKEHELSLHTELKERELSHSEFVQLTESRMDEEQQESTKLKHTLNEGLAELEGKWLALKEGAHELAEKQIAETERQLEVERYGKSALQALHYATLELHKGQRQEIQACIIFSAWKAELLLRKSERSSKMIEAGAYKHARSRILQRVESLLVKTSSLEQSRYFAGWRDQTAAARNRQEHKHKRRRATVVAAAWYPVAELACSAREPKAQHHEWEREHRQVRAKELLTRVADRFDVLCTAAIMHEAFVSWSLGALEARSCSARLAFDAKAQGFAMCRSADIGDAVLLLCIALQAWRHLCSMSFNKDNFEHRCAQSKRRVRRSMSQRLGFLFDRYEGDALLFMISVWFGAVRMARHDRQSFARDSGLHEGEHRAAQLLVTLQRSALFAWKLAVLDIEWRNACELQHRVAIKLSSGFQRAWLRTVLTLWREFAGVAQCERSLKHAELDMESQTQALLSRSVGILAGRSPLVALSLVLAAWREAALTVRIERCMEGWRLRSVRTLMALLPMCSKLFLLTAMASWREASLTSSHSRALRRIRGRTQHSVCQAMLALFTMWQDLLLRETLAEWKQFVHALHVASLDQRTRSGFRIDRRNVANMMIARQIDAEDMVLLERHFISWRTSVNAQIHQQQQESQQQQLRIARCNVVNIMSVHRSDAEEVAFLHRCFMSWRTSLIAKFRENVLKTQQHELRNSRCIVATRLSARHADAEDSLLSERSFIAWRTCASEAHWREAIAHFGYQNQHSLQRAASSMLRGHQHVTLHFLVSRWRDVVSCRAIEQRAQKSARTHAMQTATYLLPRCFLHTFLHCVVFVWHQVVLCSQAQERVNQVAITAHLKVQQSTEMVTKHALALVITAWREVTCIAQLHDVLQVTRGRIKEVAHSSLTQQANQLLLAAQGRIMLAWRMHVKHVLRCTEYGERLEHFRQTQSHQALAQFPTMMEGGHREAFMHVIVSVWRESTLASRSHRLRVARKWQGAVNAAGAQRVKGWYSQRVSRALQHAEDALSLGHRGNFQRSVLAAWRYEALNSQRAQLFSSLREATGHLRTSVMTAVTGLCDRCPRTLLLMVIAAWHGLRGLHGQDLRHATEHDAWKSALRAVAGIVARRDESQVRQVLGAWRRDVWLAHTDRLYQQVEIANARFDNFRRHVQETAVHVSARQVLGSTLQTILLAWHVQVMLQQAYRQKVQSAVSHRSTHELNVQVVFLTWRWQFLLDKAQQGFALHRSKTTMALQNVGDMLLETHVSMSMHKLLHSWQLEAKNSQSDRCCYMLDARWRSCTSARLSQAMRILHEQRLHLLIVAAITSWWNHIRIQRFEKLAVRRHAGALCAADCMAKHWDFFVTASTMSSWQALVANTRWAAQLGRARCLAHERHAHWKKCILRAANVHDATYMWVFYRLWCMHMEVSMFESKCSIHEMSVRKSNLKTRTAGVHLAIKEDLATERIAFVVWRAAKLAVGRSILAGVDELGRHRQTGHPIAIIMSRMIGLQNTGSLQAVLTLWHACVVEGHWACDVHKLKNQLAQAAARSKARIALHLKNLLRRFYYSWLAHTSRVVRSDAFEEIRRLKKWTEHSNAVAVARLIACQGEALIRSSVRLWYMQSSLDRGRRGRRASSGGLRESTAPPTDRPPTDREIHARQVGRTVVAQPQSPGFLAHEAAEGSGSFTPPEQSPQPGTRGSRASAEPKAGRTSLQSPTLQGTLQRRAPMVTSGPGLSRAAAVSRALKWRERVNVKRVYEITLEVWWRHCLRVRCERRVRLIADERDALEWELTNLRNGRERCKRSALAMIERSMNATLLATSLEGHTLASLPESRSLPL